MQDQIFEGSQSEMDLQLKLALNFLPLNILPVRLIKNVTKHSAYNLPVNLKQNKNTTKKTNKKPPQKTTKKRKNQNPVTLPKKNCKVKTLK